MTREDIDNIISIICPNDEDFEKPIISSTYLKNELEALALEQEPCTDAISRQAVDDAIYEYSRSCDVNYAQIMEFIEKIPPVTPQYTDAEIQKMQELEQAEIQKAYELGKAEMQPCEDAISRQAVLEIIRKCHCEEWIKADIGAPIEALQSVTPAEKQEPREDVSDINDGNIYECPCGYGWDKNKVVRYHFCPNCGRKVQEVKDEN